MNFFIPLVLRWMGSLVHSHPVAVSEPLNYRLMKLICKPITMTTCQQRHHQVSNGVRDETTSSQSVCLSGCHHHCYGFLLHSAHPVSLFGGLSYFPFWKLFRILLLKIKELVWAHVQIGGMDGWMDCGCLLTVLMMIYKPFNCDGNNVKTRSWFSRVLFRCGKNIALIDSRFGITRSTWVHVCGLAELRVAILVLLKCRQQMSAFFNPKESDKRISLHLLMMDLLMLCFFEQWILKWKGDSGVESERHIITCKRILIVLAAGGTSQCWWSIPRDPGRSYVKLLLLSLLLFWVRKIQLSYLGAIFPEIVACKLRGYNPITVATTIPPPHPHPSLVEQPPTNLVDYKCAPRINHSRAGIPRTNFAAASSALAAASSATLGQP